MPSEATVREALANAKIFHNLTGSWELQELIVRFLAAHNIADISQFRLPRTTVHGGVRGQPQHGQFQSTDMPEQWSENTARRLEMHTARFWLKLFEAHAPHLLGEAIDRGVDPDLAGIPEPHDGFFFYSIEEEKARYLELFQYTRNPKNLKALDFNPTKHSTVVDGHEIQVCCGQWCACACARPSAAQWQVHVSFSPLPPPPSSLIISMLRASA